MRHHYALMGALLLVVACGPGIDSTAPEATFALGPCAPPNFAIGASAVGGDCPVPDLDPTAPGVYNGWSESRCFNPTATADVDGDGIVDSCERALAADFGPYMRQSLSECSWAETDTQLMRLKGEYYYVVVKDASGLMTQIVYLPSYYRDCGYHGHAGDSEFIGVKVDFNTTSNHWLTQSVFLSAHCGADIAGIPTDANCRLLPASWFAYPTKNLGAPVVWVSAEKHANYRNHDDCISAYSGTPYVEWCEINAPTVRYPATYVWQNIGSRAVPMPWSTSSCPNATYSYPSGYTTDPNRRECIWSNESVRGFCGWQSLQPFDYDVCGTGYGALLNKYFGI